jgi:hypothetical protein
LAESVGANFPEQAINLEGFEFELVETLSPVRDGFGKIVERRPQDSFAKRYSAAFNKHGDGEFCKFRIGVPKGLIGVYALVVGGSIRYIGECEDLGKRFDTGYGHISPRNCFIGGQSTNCKINRYVLELSKADKKVDLYFHKTEVRIAVEKQLIASLSPPWNGSIVQKEYKSF